MYTGSTKYSGDKSKAGDNSLANTQESAWSMLYNYNGIKEV
jgi:hypothetical protein